MLIDINVIVLEFSGFQHFGDRRDKILPIFSLLSVFEGLSVAQTSDRGHQQSRDRKITTTTTKNLRKKNLYFRR